MTIPAVWAPGAVALISGTTGFLMAQAFGAAVTIFTLKWIALPALLLPSALLVMLELVPSLRDRLRLPDGFDFERGFGRYAGGWVLAVLPFTMGAGLELVVLRE